MTSSFQQFVFNPQHLPRLLGDLETHNHFGIPEGELFKVPEPSIACGSDNCVWRTIA